MIDTKQILVSKRYFSARAGVSDECNTSQVTLNEMCVGSDGVSSSQAQAG